MRTHRQLLSIQILLLLLLLKHVVSENDYCDRERYSETEYSNNDKTTEQFGSKETVTNTLAVCVCVSVFRNSINCGTVRRQQRSVHVYTHMKKKNNSQKNN